MLELFTTFSIVEIISFLVIAAGALKGFVSFWDWATARLKQVFKKENQRECESEQIKKLTEQQKTTDEKIEKIINAIDLLTQSDKDDIKAWITEKHHYFCYEKQQIDDYSLDCIEKRYNHYKDEGGNSFIDDLMSDLRSLKKISGLRLINSKNEKGDNK